MKNLPLIISIAFLLITIFTVFVFYKATNRSKPVLIIISIWMIVQSIISVTGFYQATDSIPPRLVLLVAPPMMAIVFIFLTSKGRAFIDSLNSKFLTLLHIVRIPVELILLALFIYGYVPRIMTFEGRNLDIISGASAVLIYYFGYIKKAAGYKLLLMWNFVCLALLLNIVVIAIFSAPFSFQQFGFDQPNIGILYFPFTLLPGVIVPIVLFSHLASIRKLMIESQGIAVTTTKNINQFS
jgi:hypothetical protein